MLNSSGHDKTPFKGRAYVQGLMEHMRAAIRHLCVPSRSWSFCSISKGYVTKAKFFFQIQHPIEWLWDSWTHWGLREWECGRVQGIYPFLIFFHWAYAGEILMSFPHVQLLSVISGCLSDEGSCLECRQVPASSQLHYPSWRYLMLSREWERLSESI